MHIICFNEKYDNTSRSMHSKLMSETEIKEKFNLIINIVIQKRNYFYNNLKYYFCVIIKRK